MLLLLHSRPRVNVFGFPIFRYLDFDVPVSLSVGNGSDTHQTLISTSTPEASSNFMRASTVLLLEL